MEAVILIATALVVPPKRACLIGKNADAPTEDEGDNATTGSRSTTSDSPTINPIQFCYIIDDLAIEDRIK